MGDKKHFNYKDIVEAETKTSSKKKKKEATEAQKNKKGDNFKVDVTDERFSALFSSANYNIDPSDPNFKKTNAMEELVKEKQKRRKQTSQSDAVVKKSKLDPEISNHSVKSKKKKAKKKQRAE